jgi:hypothetical protein
VGDVGEVGDVGDVGHVDLIAHGMRALSG